MTKDEALKLALEALEAAYARLVTKCEQNLVTYNGVDVDTLTISQEAITAIKEALAQPEHGWTSERITGMSRLKEAQDKKLAQPEQPKVRTGNCLRVGVCASEGHKIQPQRTWVGLTDDDMDFLFPHGKSVWVQETVKIIEAKLKEKNT